MRDMERKRTMWKLTLDFLTSDQETEEEESLESRSCSF